MLEIFNKDPRMLIPLKLKGDTMYLNPRKKTLVPIKSVKEILNFKKWEDKLVVTGEDVKAPEPKKVYDPFEEGKEERAKEIENRKNSRKQDRR